MNNKINEAAEKWSEDNGLKNAGVLVLDGSHWRKLTNTWIAGALSDAAKEYWFAQFELEKLKKETIAMCDIALELNSKIGTEHQSQQKQRADIDKEDVKRWFQLLVGKGEEAMKADIQETFSQPQKQLSNEEIEKLAEKEYPFYEGVNKVELFLDRNAFIKGFNAAQTQPKKQLPDVSGGTCANGVDCGCTTESHKTCFIPNRTSIDQILHDMEEYFDDRMDADEGVPNKEMNLFGAVQKLKTLLK